MPNESMIPSTDTQASQRADREPNIESLFQEIFGVPPTPGLSLFDRAQGWSRYAVVEVNKPDGVIRCELQATDTNYSGTLVITQAMLAQAKEQPEAQKWSLEDGKDAEIAHLINDTSTTAPSRSVAPLLSRRRGKTRKSARVSPLSSPDPLLDSSPSDPLLTSNDNPVPIEGGPTTTSVSPDTPLDLASQPVVPNQGDSSLSGDQTSPSNENDDWEAFVTDYAAGVQQLENTLQEELIDGAAEQARAEAREAFLQSLRDLRAASDSEGEPPLTVVEPHATGNVETPAETPESVVQTPVAPGETIVSEATPASGTQAGEARPTEQRPRTSEEQVALLDAQIAAAEQITAEARRTYVQTDEKTRGIWENLRMKLGKNLRESRNEEKDNAQAVYQRALQNRWKAVAEKIKFEEAQALTAALASGSPEERQEQDNRSEARLKQELLRLSQEVNIELFNEHTAARAERQGGGAKEFLLDLGKKYNALSWKTKLAIGIPLAGLAVASSAGWLGGGAVAAIAGAKAVRQGVVGLATLTAVDATLARMMEKAHATQAQSIVDRVDMVGSYEGETTDEKYTRFTAYLDQEIIEKTDQTLNRQIRGRRMRLTAASVAAFGLPAWLYSEAVLGSVMNTPEGVSVAAGGVPSPEAVPGVGNGAASELTKPAVPAAEATPGSSPASGGSTPALQAGSAEHAASVNTKISNLLSKEITLARGDSVWKLGENMANDLGVKDPAERLYFVDRMKDVYLEKVGNPNIKAGAVFDWTTYLTPEEVEKALDKARELSAEQRASILSNKGAGIVSAAMHTRGGAEGVASLLTETKGIGDQALYDRAMAQVNAATSGGEATNTPSGDLGDGIRLGPPSEPRLGNVSEEMVRAEGTSATTVGEITPPSEVNSNTVFVREIGKVDLVQLRSAEAIVAEGSPLATLTFRQLAEANSRPFGLPRGMTSENLRILKTFLAGKMGGNPAEFLRLNAGRTVSEYLASIRAKLPIVSI